MEAVQKQRRSVLKRAKRAADKDAKASLAIAKLNDVPTSTRKMRLVADLIRGEKVGKALSILKYQPKQGARKLEKLLLSAIANWQVANEDAKIEEADLYVKEIFVDGSRMLKRLRPAPQGRAYRVRKRSNHVTLILDSLTQVSAPIKKEKEPVEADSATTLASPKSKKVSEKKSVETKQEKKVTKKTSKNDKE